MMRVTLIGCVLVASLVGCQQKQEESAAYQQPAYEPLNQMDNSTSGSYAADPYASDQYASDTYAPDPYAQDSITSAPATSAGGEEVLVAPETTAATRVHVVQKGDTLYKLAREYYGDAKEWRTIWEANRGQIPDPDRVNVGVELIIP